MNDRNELNRSIPAFVDLYLEGEFGDLRILAEGLLPDELSSELMKALKDTENLELGRRGPEAWRKCHEKWCKSPDEACLCVHWSNFASGLLDKLDTSDGLFFERVMVLFWFVHASAYERWEDSFDYDSIGCRLHLARQIIAAALPKVKEPAQRAVLECLHDLAIQVHHGAYVENSMISNNPGAFQHHSGEHVKYTSAILDSLNQYFPQTDEEEENPAMLALFTGKLRDYLEPVKGQHMALELVGELMKLRRIDRKAYALKWDASMEAIRKACGELEGAGNFESSSELRAHIACLELHHRQASQPVLTLQEVDGFFNYGFYAEHKEEKQHSDNNARFYTSLQKHFSRLKESRFGEGTLLNATEDPAPDILGSTVGEEHFQNLMLVFRDLQVRELSAVPGEPGHLIATLTPKLYHYALGVGMLSFEFSIGELDVPGFYAVKHMASRNSGQFEYWDTDGNDTPVSLYSHTRLVDIAEKMIRGYCDEFRVFTEKHCIDEGGELPEPWIEPDQAWFTHFEVYRIHDEKGNELGSSALAEHHEYPGILCYQRTDRASLDDWINLSTDAMQLKNLAPIRAHKDDLYVISENHSICYLPDDPKFIVLQYGETSKWIFLIRCLMLYCMAESHRVHGQLKQSLKVLEMNGKSNIRRLSKEKLEEEFKGLIEARAKVQKHRTLTIGMLEHAISIGVSQYADHGLLLKRAFEEIGVTGMIDRLQDRIDGLSATQEGITVVMEDLKARQEQVTQQRLNLLLFILTVIQIVQSFDVVYSAAHGEKPKFFFPFLVSSLVLLLVIVWVYHPFRKFFGTILVSLSRQIRIRKRSVSQGV